MTKWKQSTTQTQCSCHEIRQLRPKALPLSGPAEGVFMVDGETGDPPYPSHFYAFTLQNS
ncbi:hypothetical protein TSMEX_010885 [Taenia solium]|eukprot:TsM_000356400 transcript=TsM_000356400 gene=TsM_000356400